MEFWNPDIFEIRTPFDWTVRISEVLLYVIKCYLGAWWNQVFKTPFNRCLPDLSGKYIDSLTFFAWILWSDGKESSKLISDLSDLGMRMIWNLCTLVRLRMRFFLCDKKYVDAWPIVYEAYHPKQLFCTRDEVVFDIQNSIYDVYRHFCRACFANSSVTMVTQEFAKHSWQLFNILCIIPMGLLSKNFGTKDPVIHVLCGLKFWLF